MEIPSVSRMTRAPQMTTTSAVRLRRMEEEVISPSVFSEYKVTMEAAMRAVTRVREARNSTRMMCSTNLSQRTGRSATLLAK